MKVYQLFLNNSYRNFNYLVENDEGIYCIDPLDEEILEAKIKEIGKPVVGIINTHEHWDHTKANGYFKNVYHCPLMAHRSAEQTIQGIDKYFEDGESLELGQGQILFQATPGHTMSHMSLFLENEKSETWAILTGDTIFGAGVGNCHNGGDPEVLYQTLRDYFYPLPDHIKIFPGHDYLVNNLRFTLSLEPGNREAKSLLNKFESGELSSEDFVTTLGMEREINCFFRLSSPELRASLSMKDKSDKDVFLKLRESRNNW